MSESGDRIEVVILAGGKGRRLRPYTELIPKPLVPIHGMPVVEIVLRQLKRFGFNSIALTLGYLGDLIKANFVEGKNLGLELSYFSEKTPLGTAGPLAALADRLADNFLVVNSDVITTLDFRKLMEAHCGSSAALTIAAHERSIPVPFGVIQGENGIVRGYVEKPELKYRVSMGAYAFHRRVISHIPENTQYDFPELVLRLLSVGERVDYFSFNDYWLDIGSENDLQRAIDEFPDMRSTLLGT